MVWWTLGCGPTRNPEMAGLSPTSVGEKGFHGALWPWLWSFKCHWLLLDDQIPKTSHCTLCPEAGIREGDVGRDCTGYHAERKGTFSPAELVRLDFVVRDTENICQASQQIYNMKPHPEREASVFLSGGPKLISSTT